VYKIRILIGAAFLIYNTFNLPDLTNPSICTKLNGSSKANFAKLNPRPAGSQVEKIEKCNRAFYLYAIFKCSLRVLVDTDPLLLLRSFMRKGLGGLLFHAKLNISRKEFTIYTPKLAMLSVGVRWIRIHLFSIVLY
jgi:hypothetical protein